MRTLKTYTCENCGKEYQTYYDAKRKFCCRQCGKDYTTKNRIRKCPICDTQFVADWSNQSAYCIYCSKTCYHESLKGKTPHNYNPVEVTCAQCGKVFFVQEYRLNTVKYCSMQCQNKARNTKAEITCAVCGAKFLTYQWRKDIAKYCSRRCSSIGNRGENNKNWKGGRFPYYGGNWSEIRQLARQRDGNQCQICGATKADTGRDMDVHHIVPRSKFNGDFVKANDLSNLICLCKKCHRQVETNVIALPSR